VAVGIQLDVSATRPSPSEAPPSVVWVVEICEKSMMQQVTQSASIVGRMNGSVSWVRDLRIWLPALIGVIGLPGAIYAFIHRWRRYNPKPLLMLEPSMNSRRESDGPFLVIKLRLRNPGSVAIFGQDLKIKSKAFSEVDASIQGTQTIRPDTVVWIEYKVKASRLEIIGDYTPGGPLVAEMVFGYKCGNSNRLRGTPFQGQIEERVQKAIGL